MSMKRSLFESVVFFTAAAVFGVGAASAQDSYPSRPVRLILPFPPGGIGDTVGRLVGHEMAARLGQPFVMDNRVGGTGVLGQDTVSKSRPDGYALVILSISGMLAYHFLGRQFAVEKDLAAIGQIYNQYGLLVINPGVPEMAGITNLSQLVAYAKANPGKLNYASQGVGSVGHLAMERIKSMLGVKIEHVPYKGSPPALNDLLAGRIPMMSSSVGALPYIQAGKLAGIAIGSSARIPQLPNVGTFSEQGMPGFVVGSWFGMAAPPATPKEIIGRLTAELKAVLDKPDIIQKLRAAGADPEYLSPSEFAARANRDFELWGKVISEAHIKLE